MARDHARPDLETERAEEEVAKATHRADRPPTTEEEAAPDGEQLAEEVPANHNKASRPVPR
jgi:hypothetical protein